MKALLPTIIALALLIPAAVAAKGGSAQTNPATIAVDPNPVALDSPWTLTLGNLPTADVITVSVWPPGTPGQTYFWSDTFSNASGAQTVKVYAPTMLVDAGQYVVTVVAQKKPNSPKIDYGYLTFTAG